MQQNAFALSDLPAQDSLSQCLGRVKEAEPSLKATEDMA